MEVFTQAYQGQPIFLVSVHSMNELFTPHPNLPALDVMI